MMFGDQDKLKISFWADLRMLQLVNQLVNSSVIIFFGIYVHGTYCDMLTMAVNYK